MDLEASKLVAAQNSNEIEAINGEVEANSKRVSVAATILANEPTVSEFCNTRASTLRFYVLRIYTFKFWTFVIYSIWIWVCTNGVFSAGPSYYCLNTFYELLVIQIKTGLLHSGFRKIICIFPGYYLGR
ncbi:hypothetical protein C1H46_012026 [Malus baccata]|uniref:Uncharacterized protein n=1 Tax=Malus baccata TaxID=106549 RepID=A0A540MUA8_MALBA|nr:hypothetical protein C1H46_012026 [Malus baccata]